MTNRLRAAGISAAIAFLAGCSAPTDEVPPLIRAAEGRTQAGEEEYLTGRALNAVPHFREAVQLRLQAGDLPGAALGLINLAIAERAAGDAPGIVATAARLRELSPAAQQQLREGRGAESRAAELEAGSTWLDALMALDKGDPATAARTLGTGGAKLPKDSPWPGRTDTLRAEAALANGDANGAIGFARIGAVEAAAAHDRAEEARARRLSGAAHASLSQWAAAKSDYLAATAIEETLGGGTRMAGDFRQLALIASKVGDDTAARLYTQRSQAIESAR